jgi:hypothetical protein
MLSRLSSAVATRVASAAPPSSPADPARCANCGHVASEHFCPNCGQETHDRNRSISGVAARNDA